MGRIHNIIYATTMTMVGCTIRIIYMSYDYAMQYECV